MAKFHVVQACKNRKIQEANPEWLCENFWFSSSDWRDSKGKWRFVYVVTTWKVSKYGVIPDPYFSVFGLFFIYIFLLSSLFIVDLNYYIL